MIYDEKYYIDFTSAPDDAGVSTNYRVSLRQRAEVASAAAPTRLEGGPSPFILSLGNEDDPLVVQRTASAQISFFDDVALSALLPADASEWQVTLTRTSDNKQIFIGYLTAEVYTQPAIEGPNVVTVNAASPMVPIMAETMPLANLGKLTVGELLHMALTTCEGITQVYMPAMYSLDLPTKASQYTDVLRMMFSPSLYTSVSEVASVTGEEYEYDTYDMPLEALCKLFGWSMVDPGDGSLYFISPGYEGDYMQLSLADLQAKSAFLPTLIAPQFFAEGAIQPIDTGDTVEVRQGAGSVLIRANVEDNDVELPSPHSYIRSQIFSRTSYQVTAPAGEVAKSEVAEVETKLYQTRVRLPHYRYSILSSPGADGKLYKWERVNDDTPDPTLAGAEWLRFDVCDPADLLATAEERKVSWDFQEVFRVQQFATDAVIGGQSAEVPDDLPLIEMDMQGGNFTSGAFRLNFAIRANAGKGFFCPEDGKVQGGSLKEPTDDIWGELSSYFWQEGLRFRISLKVGDYYFTGSSWSYGKAIFNTTVPATSAEWHQVKTNKTIDMPYDGKEGFYMPITEPISGPIELRIYAVKRVPEDSAVIWELPFYIKGLSFEYLPELDFAVATPSDTTYYRDFGLRFTEEKEVELPLHSRINGSEQMSLIYQNEATSLDTLYRSTHAAQAKPEEFLLDEYQRIYGRALQRWRRGMMFRELRPIDLYTRAGATDSALMLTGYTADFGANTVAVYLSDVKTINPVHYVDKN